MEAENTHLRETAKSLTKQLDKAKRLAAEAQKEAADLKKELSLLKWEMEKKERLKLEAQAQVLPTCLSTVPTGFEWTLCRIPSLLSWTPVSKFRSSRRRPREPCQKKLGSSDGTSICIVAAAVTLASSIQNFKVFLSGADVFTNKEVSEVVTGTMEIAMSALCCPYIIVTQREPVSNLPPTPAALTLLKSWVTSRPHARIFIDTTILVVLSYLILVDINLSFLWLAIFPLMAIVFVRALYIKFSRRNSGVRGKHNSGSSNAVEKTNRKTMELKFIVMVTLGALFVMDQLPDHVSEGFAISQFLLFLSTTVAALTRMMAKLPAGPSLPGIEPASEMLHKSLLVLLLVTAHTVAAEWLGEDVVLVCLPEIIPVLLWFSLHVDRKPGSSSIISVDRMKLGQKSLVFLAAILVLVAVFFTYLAMSMDESGLTSCCTTFLVSYGVSGILTSFLEFMLSSWRRHKVPDVASGMLKVWAISLLITAAAALLLRCMLLVRLGLQLPLHAVWLW
ncbi:uncharacterized protein LOC124680942 [Lolium rigidum]|uniref:uncharacterized protein LOC124680942 n=1 Tax=Lolium rigidum TaxID=89674 RepID=UPI001F5CAB66|nr:uncharacterized protein LOC124680942 [Lolium rigidum]